MRSAGDTEWSLDLSRQGRNDTEPRCLLKETGSNQGRDINGNKAREISPRETPNLNISHPPAPNNGHT
jgi:hypothetical protein